MLYKLETNFSEQEKMTIEKHWETPISILKYYNFNCYFCLFNGKGKYSYSECFGMCEPAVQAYFEESTYNQVIPRRILKFCGYYFIEAKENEILWYLGVRCFNGNIELLIRHNNFKDILNSLGFVEK